MDYVMKFMAEEAFTEQVKRGEYDDDIRGFMRESAKAAIVARWVQTFLIPQLLLSKMAGDQRMKKQADFLLNNLDKVLESIEITTRAMEDDDDPEPDFEFNFLHDMTNGIGMILPFEDKGGTPC
ncbi:MAG TPA: hypothetical protein GX728_00890 [Clostridiaceae bacterium]|nr:hypothetical protein [Clostridiaceae bacterium]